MPGISDKSYRIWPACLTIPDDEALARSLRGLQPADWQALIAQARVQQLAAMLYWRLKDGLPAEATPPAVREQLRRLYVAAVGAGLLRQGELRNVLQALAAAGVQPVIFKGAALAHTIYPAPACRPMGDIDLWVQADELDRAWQALESLGYVQYGKAHRPLEMQRLNEGEIQFYGQKAAGQGLIELHWGVFPGEWLRRVSSPDRAALRERVAPASILEQPVYLLAPEDGIIQAAAHIAINHQMTKNALRSLLDVALLAQQGLDWAATIQRARAWGLATVFGFVSQLGAELFDSGPLRRAAAELRLSSPRSRYLANFVTADAILEGHNLAASPRRFLYLLGMVDRPLDAVHLLTGSLWPNADWLAVRYGRSDAITRLRHLGAALTGRV